MNGQVVGDDFYDYRRSDENSTAMELDGDPYFQTDIWDKSSKGSRRSDDSFRSEVGGYGKSHYLDDSSHSNS